MFVSKIPKISKKRPRRAHLKTTRRGWNCPLKYVSLTIFGSLYLPFSASLKFGEIVMFMLFCHHILRCPVFSATRFGKMLILWQVFRVFGNFVMFIWYIAKWWQFIALFIKFSLL